MWQKKNRKFLWWKISFRLVLQYIDDVERLQSTLNTVTATRVLAEERERSEKQWRGLELRKLRYKQWEGASVLHPDILEEVQERHQLRAACLQLLLNADWNYFLVCHILCNKGLQTSLYFVFFVYQWILVVKKNK